MDFALNDEQRMFVKMFVDFCANEVAPLAEETDHEEKPPLAQLSAASEQGFLGATFPEEYDGAELDALSYILLLEELGKACISTALTLNVHVAIGGHSHSAARFRCTEAAIPAGAGLRGHDRRIRTHGAGRRLRSVCDGYHRSTGWR